jgi:uncharacterized membrane protein YhaH (DUF805 family)
MKDIIENYKRIISSKYATFDGRASRREFWYFVLANVIISILLTFVEVTVRSILGIPPMHNDESALANIYSLLIIVPSVAVAARRLHDIDKSGWWQLVPFYNLYLFLQKGHPGTNRFNTDLVPVPPSNPEATNQ